MAVLIDRVPGKPGRVLVTPEDGGEAFYATLELADEPVVAGNKVNRQNVIDTIISVLTEKQLLDIQVVTGGYVGDGAKITITDEETGAYSGTGRKITLGFEPDLIILIKNAYGWTAPSVHFKKEKLAASSAHYLDIFDWNTYEHYADGGGLTTYVPIKIESDGFSVAEVEKNDEVRITANDEGVYYFYAALKL